MMTEAQSGAAAASDALMELTQTIKVERMVLERRAEELEKQVSRIESIRRRIQRRIQQKLQQRLLLSIVRRAEEGGLSIDLSRQERRHR